MSRSRLAVAGFVVLLVNGGALCQSPQQNPSSPPVNSQAGTDPRSGSSAQTAPAAQKFPYPGEAESAPSAPADPNRAVVPDTTNPGSSAGKSFPYPGDPDAGESSSSTASSAAPAGSDLPAEPETPHRRKLPREFHPQSSEDRATEDLEVARFYRDKGDLQAAYLRAQDAVKTLPNDPEGHFLLGQIAQQMKRKDEAVAEFKNYLRLEPDGDHVKEARRNLLQMH